MAEEVLDQTQGETVDGGADADGKDAEQQPGWVTSVPKDYRDKVSGYESMGDFMGAALDAMAATERATIRPTEDAAPEQWAEYWKAVGRPDSPDGYELTAPEGVAIDDEMAREFREEAFAAGVPAEHAQRMFKWYVQRETQRQQKRLADGAASTERQLRDEWGADYEEKIAGARRLLDSYAPDGFRDYLDSSGLGNDPRLVKMLVGISQRMSRDRMVNGQSRVGLTDKEKVAELYPSHKSKGLD